MGEFRGLMDLASERLGASVLAASDEFFAPKENLLAPGRPVLREHAYTDRGRWMDGWETRRRRAPGHDWCLVRLGVPGVLRGVVVDTAHFRGNHPEQCSLEACTLPLGADVEALLAPSTRWVEVLSRVALGPDRENVFALDDPRAFTHLRLNIYPDGGVARLRVHGEVVPDWKLRGGTAGELDLAAVEHGGRVLASSDASLGAQHNLVMPGPARHVGDGWETRRRRGAGHDWALVQLGAPGTLRRIEVDTTHFKGSFPESCTIEGCEADGAPLEALAHPDRPWREVLPRTRLQAHTRHVFVDEVRPAGRLTHVRLNIFPDGGVSRLRLWGSIARTDRHALGVRRLDTLPWEDAEAELRKCCGAGAWSRRMAERRPFGRPEALLEAADAEWRACSADDWLEAFRAHPRIGERHAASAQSETARRWSEQEQAGARAASEATMTALAEANRAYDQRFGHIFIVCATGKSADEMLAIVRQRLQNEPAAELAIAAEEQRKITRLRLEKLLEL